MQEQRISFLLNDLVREMNGQADALLRRRFDITYSQFVFLVVLGENPNVDVTRLALRLGVTKGAVSKRLSWFVDRGLVVTSHNDGDLKRVVVSLTDKGASLAKSAGDFLETEFIAAISESTASDTDVLRAELQKMLRIMAAKRGHARTAQ